MNLIKQITFSLIVLLSASSGWTSLTEDFTAMEANDKGPFAKNMLQGTKSRTTILSGASPSGTFLFQAAYRNDDASKLVTEHDFYTGNLFTTNYYELTGEYVYDVYESGSLTASFALDHQGLVDQLSQSQTKASNMVRHWVLEKYYIANILDSGIARGFSRRGISGSEFEQTFAIHFFNYYMTSATDPFDYLAGYQLAKNSPIVDSSQLARARNLISDSYDYFAQAWGSKDSRVRGLYKIRNAIHNQLSKTIVDQIDDYLAANPWYEAEGNTYLGIIRDILVDYFNADPSQIAELAENVGADASWVAEAATVLANSNTVTVVGLLNLSESLVALRNQVVGEQGVSYQNKAKTMALIVYVTDYLAKELLNFTSLDQNELAVIAVNALYAEGLIIPDNFDFIKNAIVGAASPDDAKSMLVMTLEVSGQTLQEVFKPTLDLWIEASAEGDLNKFFDNKIKSSTMNSVSILLAQ